MWLRSLGLFSPEEAEQRLLTEEDSCPRTDYLVPC